MTDHLVEAFGVVTMIPVVSRNSALAKKSSVCAGDLLTETQIIIRDLGQLEELQEQNVGWLKSQQRITVDNFDHAWKAVNKGLGFCRIPDHMLETLETTQVVQLPIEGGSRYQVPLHLVLPKMGQTGSAAMSLYERLLADANRRMDSL